jgi:hypothetical protein
LGLVKGIPQDSSDEKSGEDEEEGDSDPATFIKETDDAHDADGGMSPSAIVIDKNDQDS